MTARGIGFRLAVSALGVAGVALGLGCAPIQTMNLAEGPAPAPAALGNYQVGASDRLTIRVLPDPPIERAVVVRPDGKITVDLIGDVEASGRTLDQISAEIQERIAEYRVEPLVSVSLDAPVSTAVAVLGEVNAPQSFPLEREIRVSQAIARAGGATNLAAASRVRVIRRSGEAITSFEANLDRIQAGDGTTDLVLDRGDIVYVPPAVTVEAGYAFRRFIYPLEVVMNTVAGPLIGFLLRGN